ncbi:MAG: hypothetical protein COU65_02605 [Candidatus Pacebacteria bacterium CG10_big_fil_rev_8_21_14_0_10_42_12]|nr:MAG: hypothetical protein COU65_02605 [Candidatus Pacebacteria bacterium CG10_big_fil_rev_8_21_14_0_10_42_12]
MPDKPAKLSASIQELTEQIETRRQKQLIVRETRQKQESKKKKRARFERLAAPIIMVLSIIISALVLLFGQYL